jgi:hypothetical protein
MPRAHLFFIKIKTELALEHAGFTLESRFQRHLNKSSPASATNMSSGNYRLSLPMIGHPALKTLPRKSIPRCHTRIQPVTDGNPKPLHIHPMHHGSKFRSMRGAMLPDIKLPLVDHFMRQDTLKFCFGLIAKQGGRQSDDSRRTMSILP